MGYQLEFMDCPTCGKRMLTTAKVCRHCGQAPSVDSQTHMTLDSGGYDDSEDDFDYDEFLEEEFGSNLARPRRVKVWVWLTAWLLIVAMLLPFFVDVLF